MTKESLSRRARTWFHPYAIVAFSWSLLGIGTGAVSDFPLARLIFTGISLYLFEVGWDYLVYFKQTSYITSDDPFWGKLKLRIISYARPIFYVWMGVMIHHVIWWESGFVNFDRPYKLGGWGQSAFILLCTTLSYIPLISQNPRRRNVLKWMMLLAGFMLPPWREPWYTEPIVVLQVRWILVAALFIVQCFASYPVVNLEKKQLADLYLLRVGWVPLVHPILMLFAVVSFLFYGFTMIKIRIESVAPNYVPAANSTPTRQVVHASTPAVYQQAQAPLYHHHPNLATPSPIATTLSSTAQAMFTTTANESWREFSIYGSQV